MHTIILAVLLLASSANAAWIDDQFAAIAAINGASCTTPQSGTTLNEGFLGTGYEETGWTEYVGTGGTVDEDHTLTGTPPTGSCTEGLYTAAIAGASNQVAATWDNGSAIARTNNITIWGSIRVNSSTLPANDDLYTILHWDGDSSFGSAGLAHIKLIDDNGTLMIKAQGAGNSTEVALTAGTWYSFVLYMDGTTAASSYFQIDAGTTCDVAAECAFTRNDSADGRYLHIGPAYQLDTAEAGAIEWGAIWIDVAAP